MDASEVPDAELRRVVSEAVVDGPWRSDALPDGLADLVERVDFFTADGRPYDRVGLELHRLHPDDAPAVAFDAAVSDQWVSPGSPGTVELSLRNTGDETREVFSGTVPPFGLVRAERRTADGEFLLWRDYEEQGCVTFTPDGTVICLIGVITPLRPGRTLTRRYDVLPPTTDHHPQLTVPPEPGDYRTRDALTHRGPGDGPESVLSYGVEFTLERP
jgi:hypothetical protein